MHKTSWAVVAALGLIIGGWAAPVDAQVAEDAPPPVDGTPPTLGATLSSPVVSPNGDGRLDRVTVRVTVDEDVTLTVRLHRPTGVGERFLATDLPVVAGGAAFVWNGRLRRPDGTWVRAGDGAIRVDVEAHDGSGNPAATARTLVVDTTAPSVHLAAVSPEPWTGRGIFTEQFGARDVSPSPQDVGRRPEGRPAGRRDGPPHSARGDRHPALAPRNPRSGADPRRLPGPGRGPGHRRATPDARTSVRFGSTVS